MIHEKKVSVHHHYSSTQHNQWCHYCVLISNQKVKVKAIQTRPARDKAGNQQGGPTEEWTVTGAGCYHNLQVSCRTSHCRLRDGGQMCSGCLANVGNMLLLLLLLVYKRSTRPNIELEHWRHLRGCLLLILEELCRLMLHRNCLKVKANQCKRSSFL